MLVKMTGIWTNVRVHISEVIGENSELWNVFETDFESIRRILLVRIDSEQWVNEEVDGFLRNCKRIFYTTVSEIQNCEICSRKDGENVQRIMLVRTDFNVEWSCLGVVKLL